MPLRSLIDDAATAAFDSADRPMDRRGNSPGRVGSADGPPGHGRNGRVARRGFGAWNG